MVVVTNITKSSSYSASNCCNNSSSHSINCMSEAERHARERDVMTVVIIGLVVTDVTVLLQREMIVIICINCYCIFICELR